jgi:hypothetical protein
VLHPDCVLQNAEPKVLPATPPAPAVIVPLQDVAFCGRNVSEACSPVVTLDSGIDVIKVSGDAGPKLTLPVPVPEPLPQPTPGGEPVATGVLLLEFAANRPGFDESALAASVVYVQVDVSGMVILIVVCAFKQAQADSSRAAEKTRCMMIEPRQTNRPILVF